MSTPMRRFAVVGSPVGHSLSPVLHRTAYRHLGIEDARYEAIDVPAGELEGFLRDGAGRDLLGVSVTMPGKPEAFAVAVRADETSRRLGISNTLLRGPQGDWIAENHDVHGIVAALAGHIGPDPGDGAVLGSGATALSAVAALLQLGCRRILLSARRRTRLDPLAALARDAGAEVELIPWDDAHRLLEAPILVSALAAPGASALAHGWSAHASLAAPAVFLDVLYDPWPAPLAQLLGQGPTVVVDGLMMLAHQADMQVRSMLGVPRAPVAEMLAAAREALASRAEASPGVHDGA